MEEDTDLVFRVANDPIRKLSRKDRLTGPALCCLKHGIVPYFLTRAVAYALCYEHPDDPASQELASFIRKNGISEAVIKYCQLDLKNPQEDVFFADGAWPLSRALGSGSYRIAQKSRRICGFFYS